jgi:hypothetical protein
MASDLVLGLLRFVDYGVIDVLQALYGLSDDQAEFQIQDWLSSLSKQARYEEGRVTRLGFAHARNEPVPNSHHHDDCVSRVKPKPWDADLICGQKRW